MDWLAVLGATGPTTLPLLCVPLRMNSVCRLPWVFGTQQGSPVMAALRTSSAVVPQKSSMAEFRCLQPWDTSPQKLQENSLASCLHLPAWSLQMFPMALRQSPKCQLQDGHRFWHTWPSAKFPKTSPLEPQPLLETLDGSSSHLMTQKWRKPSLMQSWQTAVWPWWPSSGCFSRQDFPDGSGDWCKGFGLQCRWLRYMQGWMNLYPYRVYFAMNWCLNCCFNLRYIGKA